MLQTIVVEDKSTLVDVPNQENIVKRLQHNVVILVHHEGTELEIPVTLGEIHIVDC